jgi:hypothetical protein
MSFLLIPTDPAEVSAASLYQAWMKGEKVIFTPDEKQIIWVKILNLEAHMDHADPSLIEAIAHDIEQLKQLIK